MPNPLPSLRTVLSSRASSVCPLGVVRRTSAPLSAIPSSLTTGSARSNGGATTWTDPVLVRSSSTTCVWALALSTECRDKRASVRGIATFSIWQAVGRGSSRTANRRRRSEGNSHPCGGKYGELRDGAARGMVVRVVVEVDEDVLRVVRVRDAHVRRDRGATNLELARHVEVESVRGR